MPTDSYHDYLIESLRKEPELAAAFITATLEEEDPEPELLQIALGNVAEALCEHTMTSEQAKYHQEKLKEILSQRGSEAIYHLGTWLDALGLKLTVAVAEKVNESSIDLADESEITVSQ
ncbi:MAG: transcriptional regulator [Chlorogloeopsis fritschii C42_A2020_084]|uniref:helix-turn-helix domain-containing transcriptional regulator n=1 Tax=Chlorogloeopsis fritschii TaxID=1124 RepID=UPI0019E35349|nr:transcriptional regulator [Chlorogloeopsis fritschii]MBF2007042.1 transcriptional regulator [Chlorogloeopsis fritschii C42_A2020_084]